MVEVEIGTITLGNYLALSTKIKHIHILQPKILLRDTSEMLAHVQQMIC